MATLVTPSAKSHERVKGRWTQDLNAKDRRDWIVYYAKMIFGTPVPALLTLFAASFFTSRGGLELSAWSMAFCTAIYIFADKFAQQREFRFFRLGGDALLLGFLLFGCLSAVIQLPLALMLESIGHYRWIILLYLTAYAFELFPGLNRMFILLLTLLAAISLYAIWQHFTGADLLRNQPMLSAPMPGFSYFRGQGLFRTSEILATVIAMLIPFPAATILFLTEKNRRVARGLAWILLLGLTAALFSTYSVGLWLAGATGLMAIGLLPQVRPWRLLIFLSLTGLAIAFLLYGDLNFVQTNLAGAETIRASQQRESINANIHLWQQSLWLGQGQQSPTPEAARSAGNIYFDVLAETGILGLACYFSFILSFCLHTFRGISEIPATHGWHRVLASAGLGTQVAFHTAGLYWATLHEAQVLYLFVLVVAALAYLFEHYARGIVPDDYAL